MIDVGPITPWDLFKMMCMVTAFAEFNNILFKVSRETFKFIQSYFKEKILLADAISEEVKAYKEKIKAKVGYLRLSSNCLLPQISTKHYMPSTGKASSQKFGSLECPGHSYTRCSSLVKYTQARMVIFWTPPWKYHQGSQIYNVTSIQKISPLSTDWLSYWGF